MSGAPLKCEACDYHWLIMCGSPGDCPRCGRDGAFDPGGRRGYWVDYRDGKIVHSAAKEREGLLDELMDLAKARVNLMEADDVTAMLDTLYDYRYKASLEFSLHFEAQPTES